MIKRNFLFHEGEGSGSAGGGSTVTIEQLQAEIDSMKASFETEKSSWEKESNSLKSRLGHSNTELEKYKNAGKTQEELLNQQIEKLNSELKEKANALNLKTLESEKLSLVKEYEINDNFVDLIALSPEMTIDQLKNQAKVVSEKQKAFLQEKLKEYSIVETGGFGAKKNKDKDFVDSLIEKAGNTTTDLTKF